MTEVAGLVMFSRVDGGVTRIKLGARATSMRRRPRRHVRPLVDLARGRRLRARRGPVRRAAPAGWRKHHAAQVLRHEPVPATERAYRRRRILQRPQPQANEHKRRRPTLGPLQEQPDLGRTELHVRPVHKSSSRASAAVNARSLARQLDKLAPRPQSGEIQRQVDPSQQHDPSVRRQVKQRRSKRGQAILADHRVDIVEHQDERSSVRADPVHQPIGSIAMRPPVASSRCSAVRPSPDLTRSTAVTP